MTASALSGLDAIFISPQLENVPVERLTRNLERLIGEEPRNAMLRVNLARVHAMAYSSKMPTVPVTGDGRNGPFFYGGSPHVPFRGVTPTGDPARQKTARAHLQAAIEAYEAALRLDPGLVVARLGYGWCLQEAGETARAIDVYRQVIAGALPLDRAGTRSVWTAPLTSEAAGYLMPLLDPEKDRAELERLGRYQEELGTAPRAVTPVAIPFRAEADASGWVDGSARVRFDADGMALGGEWTWIRPDVGWLVYDQTRRGQIDSALQLFGNVTFWLFWENGYQAMRALDDNGDGTLAGDELVHLGVWRDRDGDGVSDPGEIISLEDADIVALSYAHEWDDESDVYVAAAPEGATFADGSTRPTYDLLLHRR
jgi:tetratricopeptide (TPR) repeat protein